MIVFASWVYERMDLQYGTSNISKISVGNGGGDAVVFELASPTSIVPTSFVPLLKEVETIFCISVEKTPFSLLYSSSYMDIGIALS